jgi:hypothetical protein
MSSPLSTQDRCEARAPSSSLTLDLDGGAGENFDEMRFGLRLASKPIADGFTQVI